MNSRSIYIIRDLEFLAMMGMMNRRGIFDFVLNRTELKFGQNVEGR